MLIPDLLTARLRLVAITPDALDVQEKAPHFLGDLLEATIPAGWPNKDWEPHVYSFMRSQFQEHPETIGWHRYVLLPEPDHFVLIGALGSHPLGDTEAEFGYGILEPWQNNGYATEASEALIQHFTSGALGTDGLSWALVM